MRFLNSVFNLVGLRIFEKKNDPRKFGASHIILLTSSIIVTTKVWNVTTKFTAFSLEQCHNIQFLGRDIVPVSIQRFLSSFVLTEYLNIATILLPSDLHYVTTLIWNVTTNFSSIVKKLCRDILSTVPLRCSIVVTFFC